MTRSLALVFLLVATQARSQGSVEAVPRAVRFLVKAQGDLPAAQGSRVIKATWPFEKRSITAAPNAAGLVVLGLLAANAKTPDAEALAAAAAWGEARRAEVEANVVLFDPDIEALAALGVAQKKPELVRAAKAAFELRHGGANGREVVERFFIVRKGMPSLVGFDSALTLRAAQAVGDAAKADEVERALAETIGRWNVSHEHGFHLTSRAAVLAALASRGSANPLAARLKAELLAAQAKDGSWGVRNTQATAYAVEALKRVDDETARKAAQRGEAFLRKTQLASGGWATFNDFLPEPFVGETTYEVTAEVVRALLL